MLQSKLFARTKREIPKDIVSISHKYLVRGDFIEQVAAGIYSFLPLGWRVHKKIETVIRKEMEKIDAQEIDMPALIPKNLWIETGRWKAIDPPLFKIKDRHHKEFGLGSTHEEVITHLCRQRVKSYRDLPFALFQIQDKFRNEMRATGGLLRTREFIMKDLYSFHISKKDALSYYENVRKAYFKIFKKCGLSVVCVEADPGTIGGSHSHEFMVLSESGEDKILVCSKCDYGGNIEKIGDIKRCPKCKATLKKELSIESGHTFYLGTKYSKAMKLNFIAKNGESYPVIMGCYGIGLGRLIGTIVEVSHDKNGIIWPREIAPFFIHLIQIENLKKVKDAAKEIYRQLSFPNGDRHKRQFELLYDDREDKTPGEKFADADLIGIPFRIVVSEKTLKKDSVELKKRDSDKRELVKIKELYPKIEKFK